MTDLLRTLFPQFYVAPIPEHTLIQLLFWNWLSQEVPAPAESESTLTRLSGWRRKEVLDYIGSYDWTIGACEPNAKVCV